MKKIKVIAYWLCFAYYIYVFGYASLFKIFQKKSMMESMLSLGFNQTWTMFIGFGELIGVLLLLIGIFKSPFKNVGIMVLFPFAIGAFTAHMAHMEYHYFYNSLLMCVLSVTLLFLDKNFKIQL